jgi:hypothetical protein
MGENGMGYSGPQKACDQVARSLGGGKMSKRNYKMK